MPDVVIVDDEKIVRFGMKALVAEAGSAYRVVGVFRNGAEALEHCAREKVDIVFTDVKMPVMDGLELIGRLKEVSPRTRTVVLSCHDDYKIVRDSFRLGADEYILKDEVNAQDLAALMDRLAPSAPARRPGDPDPVPSPSRSGDPRDLRPFFDARGRPLPGLEAALEAAFAARGAAGGGASPCAPFALAAVSFRACFDGDFEPLPWAPEPSILMDLAEDALASAGGACFLAAPDRFFCLVPHPGTGLPSRRADLEVALGRLLEAFGSYCNREPLVAVSASAAEVRFCAALFAQAERAEEAAFFLDRPGAVFADRLPDAQPSLPPELAFPIADPEPLAAWRAAAAAWFGALAPGGGPRSGAFPRPGEAKRAALVAVSNLESRARPAGSCREDALSVVERLDSAGALAAWVDSRLAAAWAGIAARRESSSLAGAVRDFVDGHYTDDLTLEGTARRFNVSKNYLCQVFRREAGRGFVDYVNRVRVERSKELAVGTVLSIKEIAERVGYRNPNYYSRMFKRIAGMTVSEFRAAGNRADRP